MRWPPANTWVPTRGTPTPGTPFRVHVRCRGIPLWVPFGEGLLADALATRVRMGTHKGHPYT